MNSKKIKTTTHSFSGPGTLNIHSNGTLEFIPHQRSLPIRQQREKQPASSTHSKLWLLEIETARPGSRKTPSLRNSANDCAKHFKELSNRSAQSWQTTPESSDCSDSSD